MKEKKQETIEQESEPVQEEAILLLEHISKSFDDTLVLNDVSFTMKKGEFVTLLGPSGCGKTTTLRIIAGLESADHGRVLIQGIDVTNLAPNKRNVNTVFQSYALFPHMNVMKNVGYGLKIKGMEKEKIRRRVLDMLEIVQLSGFEKRMPDQLSGGQRQRVAIARALVNNPDVLLLDEPLGALDLQLRRQMQKELKNIQKTIGGTFVYITHDQEEALNMSDRIAIMNQGRFEQIGTPDEIYERPQTRFAAQFIGDANILEGEILAQYGERLYEVVCLGAQVRICAQQAHRAGQPVAISLRAERVRYGKEPREGFTLRGRIAEYSYIGGTRHTAIVLQNGETIDCRGFWPEDDCGVGEEVYVFWDPKHVPAIG